MAHVTAEVDANREIGVPGNVVHVTADAKEIYPPPPCFS